MQTTLPCPPASSSSSSLSSSSSSSSSASSSPTLSALRQLSCSIPTRLVRPTLITAFVLLSLHLLLPSSLDTSSSSSGRTNTVWDGGHRTSTHRMVWDAKTKTFVAVDLSTTIGHWVPVKQGDTVSGGGGGLEELRLGSPPSSSSSALDQSEGWEPKSKDDILLFSSSTAYSLPLLDLLAHSPSTSQAVGRTFLFAPPNSLLSTTSTYPSGDPYPPNAALELLSRTLAKLDEARAKEEGKWHADGWEKYKELTRLQEAKLGLNRPKHGLEDVVLGLKGVVLGSCADDLPLLSTVLLALATHSRFSLSCILQTPSVPSSFPTTLLSPWARTGFLTLLTPSSPTASALRSLLAERRDGDGWEYVPVFSLSPTTIDPVNLPFLTSAVAERESAKAARKKAKGKIATLAAHRAKRELRNVVVVLDGPTTDKEQKALDRFFKDVIAEISADPKFWSYSTAKSASSLAASLLSKASKFVPLLPTEGEDDDRFTMTLAVAPYWLRRPDPLPVKGKSTKGGGQPVVPGELKEVVRLAGGWTVPLLPGEKGQGESLTQAGEEERQFWQAVVDADLVLDFATEEDFLPSLVSTQSHTPLLTRARPSSPSTLNPNTLLVPSALTEAATIRVLRRGGADGVDLGRHWKLREEVVGLLRRGFGWVGERSTAGLKVEEAQEKAGANVWEGIFVRPY